MKLYIKQLWAVATFVVMSSCVDDSQLLFEVKKPESIAQYEYLNAYDVLKSYVDRNAYPNFKLGAGVGAADFNKQGAVYQMINTNFDEITAGNAMKYASVVKDNGSMDFSTVIDFIETAQGAGTTIYGHTLLWHAQQNNTYLNGLIADKPIEVDPDEKLEVEDAFVDYSTFSKFPYYVMGYEPQMIDGQLVSSYPGSWYQYFVADGIPTTKDGDYKVTVLIQGSAEGSLNVQMGNWGALVETKLNFTTEWKEVTIDLNGVPAESSFVIFQPGTFEGDVRIKWLKVTHLVTPAVSILTDMITNGNAEEDDVSCFYATEQGFGGPKAATIGAAGTGADGVGRAFVVQSGNNPEFSHSTQFFVKVPRMLQEGDKYHFTMKYRADKAANSESQSHNNPGGYLHWEMLKPNPSITTEWQEKTWIGTISADQAGSEGMNTIAFNLAVLGEANTYYFDDIKFEIEESGSSIPLTPEEKAEVLTTALETWIKGMMEACNGYVTAWDVVNEAISGGDFNGDGIYDLQSVKNVSEEDAKNNFYWQDYLGDEEFVRLAVKFAREYGPQNMQLFINDYNLESDWDDNGKLKSLIKWIERWEADGVTKIDGIGTQMHVSCYMNSDTQRSKENHIVKMLELLKASGKLIKISELDMGLVDANGNKVLTENVTEEQHKAMSDFYKFIVQKYFEIIPSNQQYGITQWAVTDSPTGSGWRGGEPIGLWDLNYSRKHTYAGFADGLSGK